MSRDRAPPRGEYGPGSDIVDFILGITFEIWERGDVDLIHGYYAPDVEVFGLEGLIRGAQAMVDGTRAALQAFPDRLLIGENVIWSREGENGFYSSHRIASPMTNLGQSAFGPATGKRVEITNIADCMVEDGVITREWLLRDNLALVRQLGIDEGEAVRRLVAGMDAGTREWMRAETLRVSRTKTESVTTMPAHGTAEGTEFDPDGFARRLLTGLWQIGDAGGAGELYAPYAVLHRSPVERYSGREALLAHYGDLRRAFGHPRLSVDHVACQPFGRTGCDIAARWTLAGEHADSFAGSIATGKPVFVLGASHWRIAAARIAREWTVFDQLAVLAQLHD